MYAELFAIVAPVLLTTGVGYGWARSGRAFNSEFVTAIITNIGTPCLVLGTFFKVQLQPSAVVEIAGAAALALMSFALIGTLVLRLAKLPIRTYLPAMMFPNNGNIGLPLCLFAFGKEGLGLAIVFFAMTNVLNFTLGQYIAAGSGNARMILRTPMIYALGFGVLAVATGMEAPRWALNTIELIGGMTIPLMLMALGVSIASLKVRDSGRSILLSVLRIGMGLSVGLGLAYALDLGPVARGVMIVQSAAPCAVFNYLFALRYNRSPEEVAGLVVSSTLLSFVLLPGLLWLALPAAN